MRRRLTLFSDCDFFAGCEAVLPVMLNDAKFNEDFKIDFFYRYSSDYERGLYQRTRSQSNLKRLYLVIINRASLHGRLRNFFWARVLWRFMGFALWPLLFLFNSLQVLGAIIRSDNRDAFYINNGGYPASIYALLAVIACRLIGVKTIVLSCNNVPRPYCRINLIRFIQKNIDSVINRSVSFLVVGSEGNRDYLIKRRGFFSSKVLLITNAIEEYRFNSLLVSRSRSKLFTSNSNLIFGIIGVHEERKGHKLLIDAVAILVEQGVTNFRVLIEGHGILTQSIRSYVEESGVSSYVEFVGDVDISSMFFDMDVLVVPSRFSEDLPNVISEALLFGVPVVGSRLAGIPSQIIDGNTGFLFAVDEVRALSVILEGLINNPEQINDMKPRCVESFYQKFSEERYFGRLRAALGGEYG